ITTSHYVKTHILILIAYRGKRPYRIKMPLLLYHTTYRYKPPDINRRIEIILLCSLAHMYHMNTIITCSFTHKATLHLLRDSNYVSDAEDLTLHQAMNLIIVEQPGCVYPVERHD